MIQPKDELIRDTKISGIKKQVAECINAVFSKGYETCFEQKKEIEDRAYKQGLEDGRRQGVAIDGDKRYWDGYHAAQEDSRKIYQKGMDDAWAVARKLFSDMSDKEIASIFPKEWENGGFRALIELKPQEAIEKIREYEDRQKDKIEIKVGTKVRTTKDHDSLDSLVFPIGTVGTVSAIVLRSKHPYKVCANGDHWWYSSDMLEVLEEDEKQNQICDTCTHSGKEWDFDACDGCTLSDSHYVASDPIESEKTVFPDSPCDLCVYNPPGSGDGKPCTMCPAEGKVEE